MSALLLAALAAAAVVLVVYVVVFVVPKLRHREIPGWSGTSFLLGDVLNVDLERVAFEVCEKAHELGTTTVQLWLFDKRLVSVGDPEDVQFILLKKRWEKVQAMYKNFSYLVGRRSLINCTKDYHATKRRAFSKAFNSNLSQQLYEHMKADLHDLIAVLDQHAETDEVVDLGLILYRFAANAIARAAFGVELQLLTSDKYLPLLTESRTELNLIVLRYILHPLTSWLPEPPQWKRSRRYLRNLVAQFIETRLKEPEEERCKRPADLLDVILGTLDDREEQLGEAALFFTAGHETTSNSLTYGLLALGQRPDLMDAMHEEVAQKLGADRQVPDFAELDKQEFKLVNAVWKETLRRYPVPGLGPIREAEEDTRLPSGTMIHKGTHVSVNPQMTNLSSQHWDDPYSFKPERFLDGNRHNPFSFTTFSIGTRNCIGQFYANMEGTSTLATLMKRYRLELAQHPSAFKMKSKITNYLETDYNGQMMHLPMKISRRH